MAISKTTSSTRQDKGIKFSNSINKSFGVEVKEPEIGTQTNKNETPEEKSIKERVEDLKKSKGVKRKQYCISLKPEFHDMITDIAEEEGMSLSSYIERALKLYLKNNY